VTAFKYQAVDAHGGKLEGIIDADSARGARALLRERGWFPLAVEDLAASNRRSLPRWRSSRLPAAELCLLTRQWATLLVSGLTMERSLTALIEQAERQVTRDILAAIRAEVLAGFSLRAALDRFPRDFPAIYRASVAAGEKSGELAKVMLQLADHLERSNALRQKTLQALLYPLIVAMVATAVVIGLMTYVVPSVVNVFVQTKQSLPLLTRALIAVSWFVREWGWLLVVGVVALLVALRQALRGRAFRMRWDRRLLRLPLLGHYLRTLDATRFASTLAILVGSGVPLLSALDACSRVVVRLPLVAAVNDAAARVREGVPLSRALLQTGEFPPLLVHMVGSAEATGQLDTLLARAAQLQQADLENRTVVFTTLMEPALLLTMGGLVLLIVLAVMEPIIELNQLIH
jgi:general secretion pathway protein F